MPGSFLTVKRPGRGLNNPPPSSVDVVNELGLYHLLLLPFFACISVSWGDLLLLVVVVVVGVAVVVVVVVVVVEVVIVVLLVVFRRGSLRKDGDCQRFALKHH